MLWVFHRECNCVSYSLMKSRISTTSVGIREVFVCEIIFTMSHLMVNCYQMFLSHSGAHLYSVVTKFIHLFLSCLGLLSKKYTTICSKPKHINPSVTQGYQFIDSSSTSLLHIFIYEVIHSLAHSPTRPLARSPACSFVHLFILYFSQSERNH